MMSYEYVTTVEAAKLLELSYHELIALVEAGELAVYQLKTKDGPVLRLLRADLESFREPRSTHPFQGPCRS
jgi:hypothetical protein